MVESFQLLLVILAIVLSMVGVGLHQPKFILWARRFAAKPWLVISCVAVASFLGGLVVAGVLHEPVPRVHDEFSYVLMSNTFASGHVSTPAPLLPEFFETFHVLVNPVYASKYFPVQGILLAIGEKLTGHSAIGIWLSAALAGAATCWMLQAWVGPVWGMLGGFLMVLQYGVYSYWSQSFWGGMAAALGGALFLGAIRRLWGRFSWQNAIWLAFGAVILINSRPLEGVLATVPVSCLFAWKIWRERKWTQSVFWSALVIPASAVLLLGAAATCSYNRAITGSLWKSPYMLHEEQYQESPPLIFMSPRPKITYSSETLRVYYEVRENGLWARQRNLANFVRTITGKLYTWWVFFCGVLLTPPLILPAILNVAGLVTCRSVCSLVSSFCRLSRIPTPSRCVR
jgi:hypothetical protein